MEIMCATCVVPILSSEKAVVTISCGHVSHASCVQSWVGHAQTCAQCRQPVKRALPVYLNLCEDMELTRRCTVSEQQLQAMEDEIVRRGATVRSQKIELTQLVAAQTALVKIIKRRDERIQQESSLIEILRKRNDDLWRELEDRNNELWIRKKTEEKLRRDFVEWYRIAEAQKCNIDKCFAEMKQLHAQIKEMEQIIHDRISEIAEEKAKQETLYEILGPKDMSRMEKKEFVEHYQKTMDELQLLVERKDHMLQQKHCLLNEKRAIVERLTKQIHNKNKEITQLQNQTADLQKKIETLHRCKGCGMTLS